MEGTDYYITSKELDRYIILREGQITVYGSEIE